MEETKALVDKYHLKTELGINETSGCSEIFDAK